MTFDAIITGGRFFDGTGGRSGVGGRAVWRSGARTDLVGRERTGQFLRHGEPAPAARRTASSPA